MDTKLIAQLAGYFLIVNLLGLYVGHYWILQDVQPTIINDDPNDVVNSFGLLGYMLVGTLVILIAIKFFPDKVLYWFLKGLESLALFFTSLITMAAFLPDAFAVFTAMALIVIRIFFPQFLLWRNVSSTIATVGVGSLLGASIGVWPVIVFLVLLGVYDYIAVFRTKHMVTMAKAVAKKNLSFTFALPTSKHQFELGTGDLVMPLVFSVAVLGDSLNAGWTWPVAIIPSLAILAASFAGLAFTLDYGSKNVGKALPALPLQVGLMIIMYGVLRVSGLFG